MGLVLVRAPVIGCPLDELLSFALTYDGHRRLADSPEELHNVVQPVLDLLAERDDVPSTAGLDLLRGSLFYLQRASRHSGDVTQQDEYHMRLLHSAITRRSEGLTMVSDADEVD